MIGIIGALLTANNVACSYGEVSVYVICIHDSHGLPHQAPTLAPAGILITVVSLCLMSLLQAKAESVTLVMG